MKNVKIILFCILSIPAISQKLVPDFVETTATVNSSTITVAKTLSQSDVGKVITIFDCTKKSGYSNKIVSTTTIIASVIDSNTITVESHPSELVTSVKCYIGTNNFDALQSLVNAKQSTGSKILYIPFGKYYIVPLFSAQATKAIVITGDLTITGDGKDLTVLKWGGEDIHNISDVFYQGFYFKGNGKRSLMNFTMEGADRTSTETLNLHTTAIFTEQVANVVMDINLINLRIKGKQGWGFGLSSSRGGAGYVTNIINSEIEAKTNPINYFSQDGAYKSIHLTNVILDGGGGNPMPSEDATICCSTLTVNNPNFSFYDLRSQESIKDRKFAVKAGSNTYLITAIISPTVATINSSVAYSGIVNFMIDASNNVAENHTVYMHPNVNYRFENVQLNNSRKLSFRTFSSGGVTGVPTYQEMDNVIESRDLTLPSSGGCQFESYLAGNLKFNNCNFSLGQSSVYNVDLVNTNIVGGQFFGNVTATNCTGTFDHRGVNKSVTISNSNFSGGIYPRGTGSNYTITNTETPFLYFQESIASLTQDAVHVGRFQLLVPVGNIASYPSIYISNIVKRSHYPYPLFSTITYTAQQKQDMINKFIFTNCEFDTNP